MRKVFILLLVFIVIAVYKVTDSYIFIPDSSIRLRVIPNSNRPDDIYMKEQVKKYLENNIYSITKDIDNIDDARDIISNNIPNMEENIDTIFLNNNYDVPYEINFGYNYFPKKIYKGVTYDEGYYESLVISIGNGEGDNFWCVLFPNFCLIDTKEKHEYKSYFKELITKYSK